MHPHTQQLCDALDRLNRRPTWHEASRLGVELVDHDDNDAGSLYLANGDVVYPTSDGWTAIKQGRTGRLVRFGDINRVHNPGVDPTARVHATARIDPTACVEAGAVIGPRVHISADAHIGKDTHVSALTFVGTGAFVGAGTTVRGGCHIGAGAVIGAGSDLGSCSRINTGSQLAQGTVIDADGSAPQTVEPNQTTNRCSINPWLAQAEPRTASSGFQERVGGI